MEAAEGWLMETKRPRIGQSVTVHGRDCTIIEVYRGGTIDVASKCGRFYWRVTGLAFV
jgi:hypothetical protein